MMAPLEGLAGRIGPLWGLLAPLRAILSPSRYFDGLRGLLKKYGIYVNAVVFFGAWISSSILAFILILLMEAVRSIMHASIVGFLLSPVRAAVYSLLFPVVPALLDAVLIMLAIAAFPRERPLYDVFAVRASSLLPYTLRVVLLEYEGRLSLRSLVAANMSPAGLGLLLVGAALTVLGLRRTMGVSWPGAIVGGLLPLAYKIALGLPGLG